jgi:hypothetical protein
MRIDAMNQIVYLIIGRVAMRAPWLENVMPFAYRYTRQISAAPIE